MLDEKNRERLVWGIRAQTSPVVSNRMWQTTTAGAHASLCAPYVWTVFFERLVESGLPFVLPPTQRQLAVLSLTVGWSVARSWIDISFCSALLCSARLWTRATSLVYLQLLASIGKAVRYGCERAESAIGIISASLESGRSSRTNRVRSDGAARSMFLVGQALVGIALSFVGVFLRPF